MGNCSNREDGGNAAAEVAPAPAAEAAKGGVEHASGCQQDSVVCDPIPMQEALFVTINLRADLKEEDVAALKAACAQFEKRVQAVVDEVAVGPRAAHEKAPENARTPPFALFATLGFSRACWVERLGQKAPKHLGAYEERKTEKHCFPATGGDMSLHVRSSRRDLCMRLARTFIDSIRPLVQLASDTPMFQFSVDNRDLTLFIDGVKNRNTPDKRSEVALIGDEDDGFLGGSFLFASKWIHDVPKLHALSVEDQENVIGRTREGGKKLKVVGRPKPIDSHIKRMEVRTEEGKDARFHHASEYEYEVVRQSQPWATVNEQGLYFLAYGATCHKFDALLDSMIGIRRGGGGGGDDDEAPPPHDALLNYTENKTGNYYFIPSKQALAKMA